VEDPRLDVATGFGDAPAPCRADERIPDKSRERRGRWGERSIPELADSGRDVADDVSQTAVGRVKRTACAALLGFVSPW
jgi:hypothetical protein